MAKKWTEAVGQSLYYSLMTDKKLGIALIVGYNDERFIKRVAKLNKKFNIKINLIAILKGL